MKKVKRYLAPLAYMGLGFSQFAVAKSVGSIATNVSGSFDATGLAIQGFFALCGLVFIGLGVFKLIQWNKTDGQQAKLSTVAIFFIGGALLFYISSLITTTGDTVWGEGGGDRTRINVMN